MPNRKSLPTSDLYTVGWIAALSIERAAAISMLDERHDKPSNFNQHESDTNSYSWGQMGDHNVVIASLPAGLYGTTSAATTASGLLASLPQIRVALLVGIGGGIARPETGRDIRLGDVVVSQPEGTTGGVIQYDLGKAGQEWELKGSLSKPPLVLLHALGSLQAEHELGDSRVLEFLEVASKLKKGASGYCHQGLGNDRLFKPSYAHSGLSDCRGCDTAEEIERAERDTTDPEIHYGTIASGNMLLKDATTRDNILDSIGTECLCFEMEAAGLMNHFPCLVIRGICDYADSHKNDRWQRYAAATAAAYGKDLLGYVPMKGLQESEKAIDILHSVQSVHVIAKGINQELQDQKSSSHFQEIKKWLSASDVSKNLFEALKKRHEGTCAWILQCRTFQEWHSDQRRFIWLHGIPGCGKTVLSAAVIDHLQQLNSSDTILEFFFDFADNEKQTIDQLLRTLSHQLYSRNPSCRPDLDKLFISCENGGQQPGHQALAATLLQMLRHCGKVHIIIDALDECKTRREVLRWIEDIFRSGIPSVRLLATSRREGDIESELERWLEQQSILSTQEESVNHDIREFVHSQLLSEPGFERWRMQPGVQNEIETHIMLKANGM
ncbi:Pfs NACHT and ankyrin domain protein [Penicillium brevicompactum]|uniref:Pfs NACHT and ankyrin domain protein n=1 Tax=Penicillium brevicompactum TaxID=5074 RepID=A0A9W9QIH7_PENBR|nr:Pfs NACHT and ankyrin domain protein [Penicillium brevicompactum]